MDPDAPRDRFRRRADAGDWLAAAATLGGSREPGDVWLRTLARNLDAMRERRPDVFAQVSAADAPVMVVVEHSSLELRIARAFADLEPISHAGQTIALAGIGDGALLRALAKCPHDASTGGRPEVCVIEPDAGRLLAAFGHVDLTGPRGPIEQARFDWYAGPAWADALIACRSEVPPHRVYAGEVRPEIAGGLDEVHRRLLAA